MTDLRNVKLAPSSMGAEAKRERLYYLLLGAGAFVLGAFLTWRALYDLCNIIGAIVSGTPRQAVTELVRMAPVFLASLVLAIIGMRSVRLYAAPSTEARAAGWNRTALTVAVLGIVMTLWVPVGLIAGFYHRLVEGHPSLLYPLDAQLFGLLALAWAYFARRYSARIAARGSALPAGPAPHRGLIGGLLRGLSAISYVLALCGFAACVWSFVVMDWSHGGVLFNVALWLCYALAAAMVWVYRLVWCETVADDRTPVQKCLALGFLVLNVLALAFYFLTVEIYNEAPNQNAFGVLPIEFTASVHAFALLYVPNLLLCPLIAFLGTLKRKEK